MDHGIKPYKVACCLIIKDENDYLQEWLDYHRSIGVSKFYIYDNESIIPVKEDIDVCVKFWPDNKMGSQMRAYMDCKTLAEEDFVAFIDTDEFIVCENNDLPKTLALLEEQYGRFDGLAMYWRFYGKSQPYFEERQPQEMYTEWHNNEHVKSVVRIKNLQRFPDPHKAIVRGKYIDEKGRKVLGPLGVHSSELIWIKHIYSRSLSEWREKIVRGSGDKVERNKTIEEFYQYNDRCKTKL